VVNSEILLTHLKKLLAQLEVDLRERADEVPTLGESLRSAHQRAKQAERTAQPFETWREEYLTQAAVAWVLACVFVRFIEDNGLIETPLLAGSGPRLDQAKDQRTLYFQRHPTDSDREYLHYVFRKVEALPAAAPLFDERHNPLWAFGVSGDGATLLIEFWQRIDPATGALAHDFTDPALNTRFLGDLYQDLSEAARKKYALLQTPEFVEEFILEHTLTPAIKEFGLAKVQLIDPACGSGHFLLGGFHRLLREWQKSEPAVNVRELAQRALGAVHGVDLNPYAVAIARFRLLIAALKASDVHRLADTPAFHINLATGDSLLHGPRPGGELQMYLDKEVDPLRHVYDTEDGEELRRILGARYHVVVGNPPYINVKDRALSEAYRTRFGSCHRKYSLAVPFMERFFDLAISPGADPALEPAGFVGMITANSFMKREFGKKLIETFIPRWDLTHVIDTSGAYIPGHGTPTVMIFGRHRDPVQQTVRAVLGIRREPRTPSDPRRGLVWSAIVAQLDEPGSAGDYVSVSDMAREVFESHPWSIGGGGAAELKSRLDAIGTITLGDYADVVGIFGMTNAEEVMTASAPVFARHGIADTLFKPIVAGDGVRDWHIDLAESVLFPYQGLKLLGVEQKGFDRWLWPFRTILGNRATFGKSTYFKEGRPWWEWHQVCLERLTPNLTITFAQVATHNHFALDTGGHVFNVTAPIIKLGAKAERKDHCELLAILNSSLACFWIKQIAQTKGSSGIGRGVYDEQWEFFYQVSNTALSAFPCVMGAPVRIVERLQESSDRLQHESLDSAATLENAERTRREMISLQEELDWEVYRLYGLTDADVSADDDAPPIPLGCRAFEIAMARRMAAGELDTAWFERHSSIPITALPSDWPESYRNLVEKRITLLQSDPTLSLLEQPEYKRRWNAVSMGQRRLSELRESLLGHLEQPALWSAGDLVSCARLADRLREDSGFMRAAERYRGRPDFDVLALVAELVESDVVPFLSVLRYKPSGLEKRAAWERTWELQRQEDRKAPVDEISVPPSYTSADFQDSTSWRLRGKLDVPKERFISYPYAEREADPTLVITWAGWDHLQQAKALAAYYVRMKDQEGWEPERLKPLLTGLLELNPWLKQWHNELDPAFGIGMGDYFAGFVDEEARGLGFTLDDVRAWQPPARNSRRSRRVTV
jgi:uncharacterized protein DUF7008/Eco57I restriction-modification methylase